MFSKVAVLFVASMAVFVAAAPTPDGGIENSCNSGPVQCCNSLMDSKSKGGNALLSLVGVAAGSVTGQVGANCSPITAIGLGGNSCSTQPVCCSNNSFKGLVAIGCTPINVNA